MRCMTVLIAIALLGPSACKKDESLTGADAKKTMGLYAKGFNALLADPKRMLSGYFSTLPADKPLDFSRKPTLFDDHFVAGKVKEAKEAFAAAKESAPKSMATLDAPAQQALAAIDKATAVYGEAYAYYQAEGYKDDKGDKGKKLHEQLIAASKEFNGALNKLSDGMSAIEDAQAADEIAKYDDKSYSYWFRYYTQQAKLFVVALERANSPEEIGKLAAIAKTLAAANEQLAAFANGKGAALNSSFKNYYKDAVALDGEVKKLMRLVGEGKTFADRELGQAADGVTSAYNILVEMGNALYQVEGVNNLKDE
jgi:uncharacterized protein DUF3829